MIDFSVTTTTSGEVSTARVVNICGPMTINYAGEIRTAILNALADADELRLDMSQVQEIDLTGLQLLCSAHKTSITMNKQFSLGVCDNTSVKKMILSSGVKRHVGCDLDVDNSCIWLGGKV